VTSSLKTERLILKGKYKGEVNKEGKYNRKEKGSKLQQAKRSK